MRGINGYEKRRELLYKIRDTAEIICLQETHSTKDSENEWNLQWGNSEIYYAHGTSKSQGVLTAISRKSGIKVLAQKVDLAGRFLILHVSLHEVKYVIINVYAPNEDRPSFFQELFKITEQYDGYRIFLGDFNIALNAAMDRNTNAQTNPQSTNLVNDYIENNSLEDIWRNRFPNRKQYSWSRNRPSRIASRIDYILADSAIAPWFKEVKMTQSYKSDHMIVRGTVSPTNEKRGPGLWRLNTLHLYSESFVSHMNKQEIKDLWHI